MSGGRRIHGGFAGPVAPPPTHVLRSGRPAPAWAAIALVAAILSPGCAAVSTQGGWSADHPADSARLIPEGGAICHTPCRIDLAGHPQEFELRIEVAGYQTGRVMIRRRGDVWQADITDLGRVPCLAISVRHGDVYAVDFAEIRRLRPVDAVTLGGGESGFLYAVVVAEPERSWTQVTHLWPE